MRWSAVWPVGPEPGIHCRRDPAGVGSLDHAQERVHAEGAHGPPGLARAGTATFERERDLSLENNSRDLLDKVTKAISRIDQGTYGTCEKCGNPIEKVRLKALPYATLCIKDAQAAFRPR
jgi:RNA polymerase-binding protein DksA